MTFDLHTFELGWKDSEVPAPLDVQQVLHELNGWESVYSDSERGLRRPIGFYLQEFGCSLDSRA